MSSQRNTDPPQGETPEPLPEPGAAAAHESPARVDPGAEREARRQAREQARGPRAERPGVMIPNRRKRLPLEAPLMRVVASAGVVAIAVAVAAIMGSQGAQAWLIGLVASVVSLVLAAVLWSSRRL